MAGKHGVPPPYRYTTNTMCWLREQCGPRFIPFGTKKVVTPKQIEWHLPNRGKIPCNLHCPGCEGGQLDRRIEVYDASALALIEKLRGKVPRHVFSGAFTEPTLNRDFATVLEAVKNAGAIFGIHTNGTLLMRQQTRLGFLDRVLAAATPGSYLSVAVDAATPEMHSRVKRSSERHFGSIIAALKYIEAHRGRSPLKVRATYLINEENGLPQELRRFVRLMRGIRSVDTIRFAFEYPPYGTSLRLCQAFLERKTMPLYRKLCGTLQRLLSRDPRERPHVFMIHPSLQDFSAASFRHCFAGFTSPVVGADGFIYKCSATASRTFSGHRIGRLTPDVDAFLRSVLAAQNPDWNPQERCFPVGARCDRGDLAVNQHFEERYFNHEDAT